MLLPICLQSGGWKYDLDGAWAMPRKDGRDPSWGIISHESSTLKLLLGTSAEVLGPFSPKADTPFQTHPSRQDLVAVGE